MWVELCRWSCVWMCELCGRVCLCSYTCWMFVCVDVLQLCVGVSEVWVWVCVREKTPGGRGQRAVEGI